MCIGGNRFLLLLDNNTKQVKLDLGEMKEIYHSVYKIWFLNLNLLLLLRSATVQTILASLKFEKLKQECDV